MLSIAAVSRRYTARPSALPMAAPRASQDERRTSTVITLLVRQADQPALEILVEGNIARVGRAPGSELHLPQSYVSKQHLRVLKGIVIVDLGSSNGTYLDGKRIKEPVLYTGGELRIGDGDVFLSVRLDDAVEQVTAPEKPAALAVDPEAEQNLHALQDDLARLEGELRESGRRVLELEAERAAQVEPSGSHASELEALAALESARVELGEQRAQVAGLEEKVAGYEGQVAAFEAQVASLQAQAAALQAQLSALQAQPARPAGPVSPAAELFLRLQSENSALKRKLADLESRSAGTGSAAPAAPEGVSAKLLAEIVELRAQNAALRAQGGSVRAVPAQPVKLAAPTSNVRALFARLAREDVDRQAPLLEAASDEFLVVEQFRLVRHVERIVTRMAGDFIQLYNANTMLPDLEGNLRKLIERLDDPADDDVRRELLEYFSQLSRWLVASLGAHRKAAAEFAQKLKADLSESALIADSPIPTLKRISGQGEAELWRRTTAYLRELTPDMVDDRLEKMARAAALELFGQAGS